MEDDDFMVGDRDLRFATFSHLEHGKTELTTEKNLRFLHNFCFKRDHIYVHNIVNSNTTMHILFCVRITRVLLVISICPHENWL